MILFIIRQLVCILLLVIDWRQTLIIADNPDKWYEKNPILGKYPSASRVNKYFLILIILHTLISYSLSGEYRLALQYIFIGMEGGVVTLNYLTGIRSN